MTVEDAVHALEMSGSAIGRFCLDLTPDRARWRPAPGKWSVLEVVCHLADEERDDFRTRFRLTVTSPDVEWPPIDPQAWVLERNYAARDLGQTMQDFAGERRASLAWLRALPEPDLDREHLHPRAGALRAGDLLASWVAHDLLHLRQLVNIRLAWVREVSAPYSTRYAEP